MSKNVFHIPVLLEEVIDFLKPKPNQNFIDCTIGFSGHSKKILEKISPQGKLLGIDLDKKAIEESKKYLSLYKDRVILVEDSYSNIKKIIKDNNFVSVDGVLFDFGISSYQLEDESRGFSYKKEGKLKMCFGEKTENKSAEYIINFYSENRLKDIFRRYGELNNLQSGRLAREIIKARRKREIKTTTDFKNIVLEIIPLKFKQETILSKVFQAIRIETNQELKKIEQGLKDVLDILKPGGRIVCISYHSLEDRIVKQYFKRESKDCLCPEELPECRCNHEAKIKLITKRPIIPQRKEIENNIRSRSAKMRVAEKI